MLGAILGDIIGSRFEFDNIKHKHFMLFDPHCFPTDDSIMTLAIAEALLACQEDRRDLSRLSVQCMQAWGRRYPDAGYGNMFSSWLHAENPQPYHSFGNGAAMRVSPCGFAARSLSEAKSLSHAVTSVTHDHPEGLKGAEATSCAIFLAKSGASKQQIHSFLTENYYPLDFTLDRIRESYYFNETCQETVPQALQCFFEGDDYEDCIRNAVSLGGDSDTLAAITGGIAQAFFGIPDALRMQGESFLNEEMKAVIQAFEEKFS